MPIRGDKVLISLIVILSVLTFIASNCIVILQLSVCL